MRDLYQEVILDHNRRPRNFRKLVPHSHTACGHNPLCGDQVEVYLQIEGGVIRDIAFQGEGCAISTASASIMTETVLGRTTAEARSLFAAFHDLLTADEPGAEPGLEKLVALAGVRDYPSRVKCATLPWHTLKAALEEQAAATTESIGV